MGFQWNTTLHTKQNWSPSYYKCTKRLTLPGRLPDSLYEAVIVVLPKPGRDPLEVGSYRPLSMLNIDYKILSKVLANRLLPMMKTLVHTDQYGFIPRRATSANIHRLYNIMRLSHAGNPTPIAVLLDFEKAFDTLEWPFLMVILQAQKLAQNF